ncbi:MAG: hypothetical protein GF317_09520 [Candidatus Lokiarchaeota archaeon]|nr:hypothetical protein [Candidatus Lokiarchaeota archaeon]MBD3199950.1 hypothetical protein [Candidatus Lokiarchaeota archaeon]
MTISNREKCINLNELIDSVSISFVCPVCKEKKELEFPKSAVDQAKNLTTISIPKGLICKHHFQAFVDKNYIVRGYQKVDYQFKRKPTQYKKNLPSKVKDDKDLFNHIIREGNYVEYYPNKLKKIKSYEEKNKAKNIKPQEKTSLFNKETQKIEEVSQSKEEAPERTLKEVYEDFWDYIDDDNEDFREFIYNDPRRPNKKSLIKSLSV